MKTFPLWETAISADAPSGVNIEYDSRFLELQNAAEGKAEQQYGDTIIPAQDPEWRTVEKLCYQLLAESKDLRLFAYYTQALTAKYGLQGFAAACEALKINLESFWDTVYPLLEDEDGEYDPFYRINALSLFSVADGIAKELLSCPLLVNGLAQQAITVREALAVLQGQDNSNYLGGRERLILDIRVGVDTGKPELQAIRLSIQHLQAIQQIFIKHLGDDGVLDFSPVLKGLMAIEQVSASQYDTDSIKETITQEVNNAISIKSEKVNKCLDVDAWRHLNIQNRADVDLVLEKICVYFENFEPSHPAPLLIRRVQKFMNMNFYDIMMDISPESIPNLEVLIGKSEREA
ncbi:MAG: type VI secretion system protein TssA [Alysiella sp.]|uniref:type VI secretion system protein TssA n=1 Tax=Alysiella sp. TaxID=1872483 RepID=UPI0026DCA652|nr:type VI secretion system protein TssA [Alysiella sp.]MDO4433994.1 type VI secretion system protein TssA [Alysiella sp.]